MRQLVRCIQQINQAVPLNLRNEDMLEIPIVLHTRIRHEHPADAITTSLDLKPMVHHDRSIQNEPPPAHARRRRQDLGAFVNEPSERLLHARREYNGQCVLQRLFQIRTRLKQAAEQHNSEKEGSPIGHAVSREKMAVLQFLRTPHKRLWQKLIMQKLHDRDMLLQNM